MNGVVFFTQWFYINHVQPISTGIGDKQKVPQTDVGGIGRGLLAKQDQRKCAQKSNQYANSSFGAYVFFEEYDRKQKNHDGCGGDNHSAINGC